MHLQYLKRCYVPGVAGGAVWFLLGSPGSAARMAPDLTFAGSTAAGSPTGSLTTADSDVSFAGEPASAHGSKGRTIFQKELL